jgi:hypothetical protein
MNDSLPAPNQDEIERRAFHLWEERGRPIGSPDVDWLLAEQELTTQSRTHSATAGRR